MRWTLQKDPNEEVVYKLSKELSIDKTLAQLLVQRGISSFGEAKIFFRPSLNHLHDPFFHSSRRFRVLFLNEHYERESSSSHAQPIVSFFKSSND